MLLFITPIAYLLWFGFQGTRRCSQIQHLRSRNWCCRVWCTRDQEYSDHMLIQEHWKQTQRSREEQWKSWWITSLWGSLLVLWLLFKSIVFKNYESTGDQWKWSWRINPRRVEQHDGGSRLSRVTPQQLQCQEQTTTWSTCDIKVLLRCVKWLYSSRMRNKVQVWKKFWATFRP